MGAVNFLAAECGNVEGVKIMSKGYIKKQGQKNRVQLHAKSLCWMWSVMQSWGR